MEPILISAILVGFLGTLFVLQPWIKKAKRIGLEWEDMNMYSRRKIAGSGGIAVLTGFTIGVLSYIAIKTFILNTNVTTVEIFALLTTLLIAGIIGIVDDFLGWVHGGLSARLRIFLLVFAAVPLMVINAGVSVVSIPFLGVVNLGLFFPLLLIPIAIVATSTAFNMLAGFNGLEASQGILILSALSFVSFMTGKSYLGLLALILVASLIVFYIYNKFPASILPGDSLTYSVGAMIGVMAILGNMERIAAFFFIPYILEVGLKLRGGLKKQSFGKPNIDDSLEVPYKKFYGLEHIAIAILKKIKKRGRVYQKDVTLAINIFQIVIILLGLLIFKDFIFI